MTPQDFDWLRKLLKERSGLTLSAEKEYLLESRLLPIARRHGVSTLTELVAKLKTPGSADLVFSVVEAMTTNETFFFRDKIPFDHLRETVLPALIAARAKASGARRHRAARSRIRSP